MFQDQPCFNVHYVIESRSKVKVMDGRHLGPQSPYPSTVLKCHTNTAVELLAALQYPVNWLHNFVERSLSWEVDSSSAGQEVPHILCYPKVLRRIHNSLPLVDTLNQSTIPQPISFRIHFNIILLLRLDSVTDGKELHKTIHAKSINIKSSIHMFSLQSRYPRKGG